MKFSMEKWNKYFHQSQKCLNWPAGWKYLLKVEIICPTAFLADYIVQKYSARTYLQLPFQQWGAGNVYLLVLSSWKVNIAEIISTFLTFRTSLFVLAHGGNVKKLNILKQNYIFKK